VIRSPRSCEGTPLKAAPTVVCARTSLAVPASNDARTQSSDAYTAAASRHVACTRAQGSRHTPARRPGAVTHRPKAAISG
jgi:hypothetical protein